MKLIIRMNSNAKKIFFSNYKYRAQYRYIYTHDQQSCFLDRSLHTVFYCLVSAYKHSILSGWGYAGSKILLSMSKVDKILTSRTTNCSNWHNLDPAAVCTWDWIFRWSHLYNTTVHLRHWSVWVSGLEFNNTQLKI